MPKAIIFNFPLERMNDYVTTGIFTEEDAEELSPHEIREYMKQGLSVYQFQEQTKLF